MGAHLSRPRMLRFLQLVILWMVSAAAPAHAGNNAWVLEQASTVPGSRGPGATASVMIRVQNAGDTTWSAGAMYRLGAGSQNQVTWSGYACGGYMNHPLDGRVFLCHNVAPGQTHDFRFNVTLPSSGSARLSVRMVRDGVEWFGEVQTWTINVSTGASLPDVVVDSLWLSPASPRAGQPVQFTSVVRNIGNASTPSGKVIGVGYFIDGQWVSYGYSASPLAPGASVTITTQGGPWTATPGTHTFMAVVDDVNRFQESNENNNSRSMSFTVGSASGCPTPSIATPTDRWKLEIFSNRSLSGAPVEIRTDAPGGGGFGFNWGAGRPSNCTGNDNFSIRFSRRMEAPSSGVYRFTTTTDDGLRLWVDGQLLIDRWIDQAPTSASAPKALSAGWHDVRMDYYEHGGGAVAALAWEQTGSGCPTPSIAKPTDRWKLEIFNNRSLSGTPVDIRTDAPGGGGFAFNWGGGRPSGCTGNDNFSIRFSRWMEAPSSGVYTFTTTTDDGVRLWVDGQLLIDRWIDQAPTSYRATKTLSAGWHDVRMDYYEHGGGATAALQWQKQSSGPTTGNLYGMNIDPANPKGDPSPQDLKAIGVRWVRVEYAVGKGTSFYDAKIASLRANGLKVLLIVDYASVPGKPSGTTGTPNQWQAYLDQFDGGLDALAAHYRDGVDAWQIWNEPDLAPQVGYDPYVPADVFGNMLKRSVSTIRRYSSRPVITGGLASGDPSYLSRARSAAGVLSVDAVAVHPYGQRAPDDWPSPNWGFGNMSALFDRYLAFGKPLWVSEIGVHTRDEGFQADYLENVYTLARDRYRDQVQVVFWFCWSDGMVPPFGILRAGADPNNPADRKPAYDAYDGLTPPLSATSATGRTLIRPPSRR